jgi:glycosyltransferase involved in cell wall biosynthesis
VAVDEVAVRDETALMVAPGDVKGFRAAIEKLLDDDERRQSMGAAARRKALDRSWAATFEGVSSVYHQMLS